MKVISQEIEKVKVSSLVEFPDNPNKGAVTALENSMEHLGYYGAICAQKSTRRILAGNHRWQILVKEDPGLEIPVVWLDVDDAQALAILIGDNRINRLGRDDEVLLFSALSQLDSDLNLLAATGYTDEDIAALADSVTPRRDAPDEDGGSTPQRDPGNPVVQYQIVFQDEDEQQAWYGFLRWLKKTVEGDTMSERLTKFISQFVEDEEGE